MEPSNSELLRQSHADLSRKYSRHASRIKSIWLSLPQGRRVRCMRDGAARGEVLRHPLDARMGNVCKVIPEWNLRDVTTKDSYFLDLLAERATNSLYDLYTGVPTGEGGDHSVIEESMRTRNLRHTDDFKNCFTTFLGDDDRYGDSFRWLVDSPMDDGLRVGVQAGLIVPQGMGELIVMRQQMLINSLSIMIDDVLAAGREMDAKQKNREQPPAAAPSTTAKSVGEALAKLSVRPMANSNEKTKEKVSLPELVSSARDQEESAAEVVSLLSEPTVLDHAVNFWFFSRPEVIPDERGRLLPAFLDRNISAAVFDAAHSSVQAVATWTYIRRLAEQLLETTTKDKGPRAMILQELSNACHLEYTRAQSLFRRHVQTGPDRSKYFRRVSNAVDAGGSARVVMKAKPDTVFANGDTQLSYMLRLCQAETGADKAADWAQKLADLHGAHEDELKRLSDREMDAFGDLAVIISFTRDLSSCPAMSVPAWNRNKANSFVNGFAGLEKELRQTVRADVDLADFAVPIENLLEPGMADGCLRALDRFVTAKTGSKLGSLYQNLVDDCFAELEKRIEVAAAAPAAAAASSSASQPVSIPEQPQEKKRTEQPREKAKTRPAQPSVYDIAPTGSDDRKDGEDEKHAGGGKKEAAATTVQPPKQPFQVRKATVDVFAALFDKSASGGDVAWDAFEAAMADVGFSVVPKLGSVYTFYPPASMMDSPTIKRPITLHRPHGSRIEGYRIHIVARRLKRAFGWDETSFAAV